MTNFRGTFAEVDLGILRQNFLLIQSHVAQTAFLCPMVKANAYGHGDVEIAQTLRRAGAQHLGVALIEEGEKLRRSGDHGSILIFAAFDQSGAQALKKLNLTPVVSDWSQISHLEEVWSREPVKSCSIHIEFNTGMNRLGFPVGEAEKLRAWLDQHPVFRLEGVCTHLLRGADAGVIGGESDRQLNGLMLAVKAFQGLKFQIHALNSAGASNVWRRKVIGTGLAPSAHLELGIRPGISLYGSDPETADQGRIGVRPFLKLKTKLIAIHRVASGEKVSYDATWVARRESLIGVVPVGYADGYPRCLSNRAEVLCRGQRVPVVGTICMDYFMIDLTELEPVGPPRPGDEVVLIGTQGENEISVLELAKLAGTVTYEIFTGLSARVPRRYV